MGFFSCFLCGSVKDEAPDAKPQTDAAPQKGADAPAAEKKSAAEAPKSEAPTGAAADAAEKPAAAAEGAAAAPAAGELDPQAAEEKAEQTFGSQHLVNDEKVQEAKDNHPYPVTPGAVDAKGTAEGEGWHDADAELTAAERAAEARTEAPAS